jgi:hypothetical protein
MRSPMLLGVRANGRSLQAVQKSAGCCRCLVKPCYLADLYCRIDTVRYLKALLRAQVLRNEFVKNTSELTIRLRGFFEEHY